MSKRKPKHEPLVTQVGARIRFLRLENGLSIRKVAELAECSPDSVMQIELGRSASNMKTLQGIARALMVEPFDLLNCDTERDDVGYIVEKMRQDPETAILVNACLKSWALVAGDSKQKVEQTHGLFRRFCAIDDSIRSGTSPA